MSIIRVTKFKEYRKGPLIGFVDIEITTLGMGISGISWFCKDGRQWFSMPSKKFTDENGEEKYSPYIFFPDKKIYANFQDALRNQMSEYMKIHHPKQTEQPDDNVPF